MTRSSRKLIAAVTSSGVVTAVYFGVLVAGNAYGVSPKYAERVLLQPLILGSIAPTLTAICCIAAWGIDTLPHCLWRRYAIFVGWMLCWEMTLGALMRDMALMHYSWRYPEFITWAILPSFAATPVMVWLQSHMIERERYVWPRPVDTNKRSMARGY